MQKMLLRNACVFDSKAAVMCAGASVLLEGTRIQVFSSLICIANIHTNV